MRKFKKIVSTLKLEESITDLHPAPMLSALPSGCDG